MNIVVKKFGGTSVGDVARIRRVAERIRDYRGQNPDIKIVVVVSAMAGETDRLLKLGRSCVENPSPSEMDVLAATGEQITIALLSMALQEFGLGAQSLLGFQAGILTDENHQNAQIVDIKPEPLMKILNSGTIAVVAGFQGVTPKGSVTTLGRGGSDITAVAIAAALKADACMIYSDVDGVYSADPRLCKKARRLGTVSHEEMLELASQGAKVLHHRCIEFAHRYAVPLIALSTFHDGKGTRIVEEGKLMERPVVSGITYRNDEAKLTISKMPGGIASLSDLFATLSESGIFVDMITQTGMVGDVTAISFTVPDESSRKALELVQGLVPKFNAEGALLDRDISKVSVVGSGMRTHSGVAARMFQTLAKEGIEVSMISTSEIKISVLVPRKYGDMAVRALHEAFIEMKPEVSEEKR